LALLTKLTDKCPSSSHQRGCPPAKTIAQSRLTRLLGVSHCSATPSARSSTSNLATLCTRQLARKNFLQTWRKRARKLRPESDGFLIKPRRSRAGDMRKSRRECQEAPSRIRSSKDTYHARPLRKQDCVGHKSGITIGSLGERWSEGRMFRTIRIRLVGSQGTPRNTAAAAVTAMHRSVLVKCKV